jgi:hypothetical protein
VTLEFRFRKRNHPNSNPKRSAQGMPTPMPTLAPVERPPELETGCAPVVAPVGIEVLLLVPVDMAVGRLEVDETVAVGFIVTDLSMAVSELWNITTMPFAYACPLAKYVPIRLHVSFGCPSGMSWGRLTGADQANFECAEVVVLGDDIFYDLVLRYRRGTDVSLCIVGKATKPRQCRGRSARHRDWTHEGQQRIAVVSDPTDIVVNMFLCGIPPSVNVVTRPQSAGQTAGLSMYRSD